MIPTLWVVGAMAGVLPRGWLVIPVAALGWPMALWLAGALGGGSDPATASILGAANAAAGWIIGLPFRFVAHRIADRRAR